MSEQVHELKCEETYFEAVMRGEKTFEVRRDDRGFQKGDILVLKKYRSKTSMYVMDGHGFGSSPQQVRKRITYVLTGGQFGIEPGFVVLGLAPSTQDEGSEG